MADVDACATCPLAKKEPEEPMSPLLRHLCFLSTLQDAGAQIPFDYLTLMEWKGLAMLKAKSHEKQMANIKSGRGLAKPAQSRAATDALATTWANFRGQPTKEKER